ncbi:MAG: hypothetical protein IPK60_12200 [Sandaracinaceae bacterium]|jgi:hypothetical protein|nr:hypothetical protein [Sandaracinaceae bacterium]
MRLVSVASAVLFVTFFVTNAARADELSDFQHARSAYESQDHRTAVARFEELLGGDVPRISTRALILESRKYLGASYLFLTRRADAEHQFELLLRDDPQYELDPVAFPAEVIQIFTDVRTRLVSEATRTEAARREREEAARREAADRLLLERGRMDRLLSLAGEERVEVQHQRWIAWLPLGAGQFQNGHTALGTTFLVAESLLLATSITTYIWHATLPDSSALTVQSRAEARTREENLVTLNYISLAAFVGVAAIGIVDAHIRFVPFVSQTRHRDVPPELTNGMQLNVGFGAVQLTGSF